MIINHVQTLTAGWAVHDTERSYLENAKATLAGRETIPPLAMNSVVDLVVACWDTFVSLHNLFIKLNLSLKLSPLFSTCAEASDLKTFE